MWRMEMPIRESSIEVSRHTRTIQNEMHLLKQVCILGEEEALLASVFSLFLSYPLLLSVN